MQDNQSQFIVLEKGDGRSNCRVEQAAIGTVGVGDVRVRLSWSAINYKDALCATGHPGIARTLPIVPGIDAVGEVEKSASPDFKPGDRVLIAGPEFGTSRAGGFATHAVVPSSFVFAIPDLMTERECVTYGTAGFTAAQSVEALLDAGLSPDGGPIVITGATGGVGCFSVAILSKLGFKTVAVTGKRDKEKWLRDLGASEVVDRSAVHDESQKPLLSARWSGAIDTVGGGALGTILRSMQHGGCVTACGLAASHELPITVYPFILRGVRLQGIDSAVVERDKRRALWQRIAGEWQTSHIDKIASEITLSELPDAIVAILAGGAFGRTIVNLRSSTGS